MTAPQIVEKLDKLGVTYHGNKFGLNAARAFQTVAWYLTQEPIQKALKALENKTQEMNDQTKIQMLFTIANKTFGKHTEAAVGALVQIAHALRIGLIFQDITKERDISKEFLAGKAKKARGEGPSILKQGREWGVTVLLYTLSIFKG